MNTPPRSELPTFSFSTAYSRAPKRPSLKHTISPPQMKPFDEDSISNNIAQQRRQEREMKQDIIRQVKKMTSEDWLFRGTPFFSGNTL